MNHFFCSTCNNPLKIKEGDFLFSYNIECCNKHTNENVDIEDILSTKKEQEYICENHKKKIIIRCLDCKLDICLFCFKEFHNSHKMGYLKSLNDNDYEKHYFKKELDDEKEYINSFLDELMNFKNELEKYIKILKSDLQNYLKFRYDLFNNISTEITSSINVENVKNLFKTENYLKLKEIIENFLSKEVFIERYNNLKNLFELVLKRGKYIENVFIKDIYNNDIIPINEKYYMDIDKNKFIIWEKILDFNLKKYKFKNILERSTNKNIDRIKLKEYKNIKNLLSFYIISYQDDILKTHLYEITIKNLSDINIKKINTFDRLLNLFVLSENKIIIDNYTNISLYDASFESQKLVSNEIFNINDFIKIDSNTFIYSSGTTYNFHGIFLAKIFDNYIDKLQIINCGNKLIYFSEKKKIIFSIDEKFIYLINFNSAIPEVIQKIEQKGFINEPHNKFINHTELIRNIISFNDESIYIELSSVDRSFLIQYKIIEGELIEISRIKIK